LTKWNRHEHRVRAERQTDGHIANSLLLVGINLSVLPWDNAETNSSADIKAVLELL
jgi:hypothetical protein